MENKELKKKEMKETLRQFFDSVKIFKIVFEAEDPGLGDLFIELMMEELGALRPEPSTMNFGMAIEAVKQGKSVARKGWNGKNQFVELATCISYKGNAGEIVNCHHNDIGNKALAFIGTSGVQMGWLASQADMLADDWYIVE